MATAGKMNATLLKVYIGGTAIAHSTSGQISLNTDMRDVTTKDSSGNREVLPGLRSGSISTSGLYAEDAAYGIIDLQALRDAGTAVTVKFSTEVSGDHYYESSGYIASIELNADSPEDNVTFSATFELTGALTYGTIV